MPPSADARRVLILGAAGRDFHNFNVLFRERPDHHVVGFTATQIPRIEGRRYPPALAGPLYPDGVEIHPEADLERLVRAHGVDEVLFSYSDVSYGHIGHLSARANAAGASFRLAGTRETMIDAPVPVVAITAVRTGCGKSQTTRYLAGALRAAGQRVVVVRHPMPYGDLERQAVQRFATRDDLTRHECTFEEREEYETHIDRGIVVYAGIDYGAILERAAEECDVLLWDGGNNDWPFYTPDLWITMIDPLRRGHGSLYFPGEVNLRRADVLLVSKVDSVTPADVDAAIARARAIQPDATMIRARSVVSVEDPEAVRGKRVLCVDDGPTITHGGMSFGAARVAADRFGAAEIVDPRPHAVGSIAATLEQYPHIGSLLPAMGYFPEQIRDLERSIAACDCDVVLVGTPFDLAAQLELPVPAVRVRYELEPLPEDPSLVDLVRAKLTSAAG